MTRYSAGAGLVLVLGGLLGGLGWVAGPQPLVLAALAGAVLALLAVSLLRQQPLRVMDWAVRVTVVWVPFAAGLSENFGAAQEVIRNLDLGLTVFALGLLLLHFVEERRLVLAWTPANWPLAILLAVDAVSILVNQVPLGVGLAGMRATLQYVTLYYLLVYLNPDPARQRRYLALTFTTAALICALTLAEWLRDSLLLHVSRAPSATLGDRSALGLYLQVHVILLLGLTVQRIRVMDGWPGLQRRLRWLNNPVLLGLLGFTILVSNGRTAWVGILVGLAVIALVTGRWRGPVIAAGVLLVLAVAFIRMSGLAQYYEEHYYQLDQGSFFDRFFLLFTDRYVQSSLLAGRLYYSSVSLPVIADHPIVGVGPGRWGGWVGTTVAPSPLYAQYGVRVYYGQFDIALLPFWAENGTAGLLCLLWLWGGIARAAWRLGRAPGDPYGQGIGVVTVALILTTLLLAFTGPVLENHPWAAYLWFMGGLATVGYRQHAAARPARALPAPGPLGAAREPAALP